MRAISTGFMSNSTSTYQLLRLVRNLRTGNLPLVRLQAQLEAVRARRAARLADNRASPSKPEANGQAEHKQVR